MATVTRRALYVPCFLAAMISLAPSFASATHYPTKTVRIIVPVPPGGPTDFIAASRCRATERDVGASRLSSRTRRARQAPSPMRRSLDASPDGYMLLIGNVSTNAINFAAIPKKRGKAGRADTGNQPHPGSGRPYRERRPAGQPRPKTSSRSEVRRVEGHQIRIDGIGTYSQIDMLRFMKHNNLEATHIAYKGAAQALPALLSNEIQLEFLNLSTGMSLVKDGRLKAFATTWPERVPELPDVPTLRELGYGDVGTSAWHGMFVTEGTPQAVIDKIYASVASIYQQPDFQKKIADQFAKATVSKSPAEFATFVESEITRWAKLIKDNDIKVVAH